MLSFATAATFAAQAKPSVDLSAISRAMAPEIANISPELRVDQVGYAVNATKVAYLMAGSRVARVNFTVVGARGVVFRGTSADDPGGRNSRYHAVYELNFSSLRCSGTYRIRVGSTTSPAFRIASGQALYQELVSNGIRYFTSERDGADVVSAVLDRKPANLTDARAYVYEAPKYDSNDNLIGGFTKLGGPVNVSGGWFDAGGGYEKFGYADALLLVAARDFRGSLATALRNEAEFGLRWMRELWDPGKVVSWPSVEPPLDYSAISPLAFTVGAAGRG